MNMKKKFLLANIFIICVLALFSSCGGKSSSKALKPLPAKDFKYTMTEDGQGVLIKQYTGKESVVVIPPTIEDMPVLEVDYSFIEPETKTGKINQFTGLYIMENHRTKKIVFPDSVRKMPPLIREYKALESVTIPKSLKDSENFDTTFYITNCPTLKEVIFPEGVSFTEFGELKGCTALESITIPASVKRFSTESFTLCSNLHEIIFPENVKSYEFESILGVENNAFDGTNLDLKTQAKIKSLGYKGEF